MKPVLEQRKQFGDLDKTAWPAVNEQQRNRVFEIAFLMYEMNIQRIETFDCDGSLEVRQLIECCLSCTPVELLEPILG